MGFIREEFPEKARNYGDIAAFADGHIKGYSVTAEIFHMAEAKRITYEARERSSLWARPR